VCEQSITFKSVNAPIPSHDVFIGFLGFDKNSKIRRTSHCSELGQSMNAF
jgi:hypothetical protein